MKRRPFLKIAGAVAGSYTVGMRSSLGAETQPENAIPTVPKREIGKTGINVPVVGFPGLALVNYDQEVCNEELHRAIELGWNYLDVAPAYGDAEIRMGIALQGIERSRYFLACKTKKRDKEGAREELERSLERLKTDHFDLYQMHHFRTVEEVNQALGTGGAIETFLQAKAEGKIGMIGFSSHTTKSALAALQGFSFQTAMFPINFLEYYKFGFGNEVVEMAEKQGTSVFAMKTICGGLWPADMKKTREWWYRPLEDQEEIDLAVRFSLAQKAVASVVPTSFLDLYHKTVQAAQAYRPLTEEDSKKLEIMAEKWNSVFLDQQKQISMNSSHPDFHYPDCPFDCHPSHFS